MVFKRYTFYIVLGIVFCALSTSFGIGIYNRLKIQKEELSFFIPSMVFKENVDNRLNQIQFFMKSIVQLYNSSESVEEEEFDNYVALNLEYEKAVVGAGIVLYGPGQRGNATAPLPLKYWETSSNYPDFDEEMIVSMMSTQIDLKEVGKHEFYATPLFRLGDGQRSLVFITRDMPLHGVLVSVLVDVSLVIEMQAMNDALSNYAIYQLFDDKQILAFSSEFHSKTEGDYFQESINFLDQRWLLTIYQPENLVSKLYMLIPVLSALASLLILYLVYFARRMHHISGQREQALEKLKLAQEKIVEAEKIGAMGGLVSGIAHEVNTPLGVSVTSCSYVNDLLRDLKEDFERGVLDQEKFEDFVGSAKEMLSMALDNLRRASKLVTSFKRIDVLHADDAKRPELVNMAVLVNEFVDNYVHESADSEITFKTQLSNGTEITTYPTVILQILHILVTNAEIHGFKGMKSGKIVSIGVSVSEKSLVLKVEDNGQGVEKKLLSKIFEPFYTTNRGAGNAGLGLSVVYNLVKSKLKGEIDYGSSPDNGLWISVKINDLRRED